MAGIGVRRGDDLRALSATASSRAACTVSLALAEANPPASAGHPRRCPAVVACFSPPPRTGISAEAGSVTFRTGLVFFFFFFPPAWLPGLVSAAAHGLWLRPGPAAPAAGPPGGTPRPGPACGRSSPLRPFAVPLIDQRLMPGHLLLQADPRRIDCHAGQRLRHRPPRGLRVQPGLPLRPPRRLRRLPLGGEIRQARPHPPKPRPRIGPARPEALPPGQVLPGPRRARLITGRGLGQYPGGQLPQPASVRFASFDAFAPILTPSPATPSAASPAAAHTAAPRKTALISRLRAGQLRNRAMVT